MSSKFISQNYICKKFYAYKYISFVLIVLSIVIRIYFYSKEKFFWLDEALLFYSLQEADFVHVLIQKNIYFQTYPSLFGILSWIAIKLFGTSPYIVRFIPCFFSCIYIIMLYIVAKKIENEKYALICLSITLFNMLLLKYCDEFKQYSIESCVTIVLLLYYIQNNMRKNININFVVLYCICMMMSVPAPFIALIIVICSYIRNIEYCKTISCFAKQTYIYIKSNFMYLILIVALSLAYLLFCLRTGDANNGDAWKDGMIPLDIHNLFYWFSDKFIIILSRLMSNISDLQVGKLLLFFSLLGCIFLIRDNKKISMFIVVFIPVFFFSIMHIYSLGNSQWGMVGARLSLYLLPIFTLFSGYFVYKVIAKITSFSNKILIERNIILGCIFVSFLLSIRTFYSLQNTTYNSNMLYDSVEKILDRHKKSVLISHSYIWYSLEFYNEYKNTNYKFIKLGNQKTPVSEYPPMSKPFTTGLYYYINTTFSNKNIVIFVPRFINNKILRFINRYETNIETFRINDFYVYIINKSKI